MTQPAGPLRPEEERSLEQPTPEITGLVEQAFSPREVGEALVTKWMHGLSRLTLARGAGIQFPVIAMTIDVQRRMAEDIALAFGELLRRER